MTMTLSRSLAAVAVFLTILATASGAFSQARQFAPNAGAVVAPNAQMTPVPAERLVPGRDRLDISPVQQQSLQATMQGALGFSCNPIFCACRGDNDCNDMFTTNVCGGRAICIDDYCYCDRSGPRVAPQ